MSIDPEKLKTEVAVPDGVRVTLKGRMLGFEGPLGKTFKSFRKIPVGIEVADGRVLLRAAGGRKRDYSVLHTARSLIRNICEGLVDGYTVRMKVVYAHFPITVKVDGRDVLVENFQGERAPRRAAIVGGTKVSPEGEDVVLTGHVLTDVTQTAANIELATRVRNKDHRVFLDGIYAYEKKKGS